MVARLNQKGEGSMALFEKLGETIVNVGKDATQKAKDLSGVAKLNLDIRAKEDYIQKQYAELGKIYYEAHKGDSSVAGSEHFELIEEAKEAIEKMRVEIMELKKTKKCPKCGAELAEDAEYCSSCGQKVGVVADSADNAKAETADSMTEEE